MISGTFREWVDDGASGEWSHSHTDGSKCRVSLARYEGFEGQDDLVYEVDCDELPSALWPLIFYTPEQVMASGHVTAETPGEVING